MTDRGLQYLEIDTATGDTRASTEEFLNLKTVCLTSGEMAAVSAGTDADGAVIVSPVTGTITKVSLIPVAAHSGADTDFASIAVKNATATLVPVAAVDYTSGVDLTALAENVQTLAAAAQLAVSKGDVLHIFNDQSGGTGDATAAMYLYVEIAIDTTA